MDRVKIMSNGTDNTKKALTGKSVSNREETEDTLIVEITEQPISPKEAVEIHQESKESAGTILKRAREAQGLSLEIVHEVTKIPLDALRAIEEGYMIRMLSPFYYKGFLKMYAGYLGIDVSEVIEDYKPEELPQHIKPNVEEFEIPQWITGFFTKQRKRQMVIAAGILLIMFLCIKMIGFFLNHKPRPDVKKNTVQSGIKKIAPAKKDTIKKETKAIVEKPRQEVREQAPKIVVPKVVPITKPKEIPPVQEPVPPAGPVPVLLEQKDIVLTVRAKQNSWLRVKADDNIVFQSTLRLGAVETWTADNEIEISGKNVDQLEFELNGKMIGALGRNDRNAKKIVITKSGLSVKN